jgi:D-tyrosyl-tRNA(Tyr) deacylase
MIAVVQRVTSASVKVEGQEVGSIGKGLLVFLGVGCGDTQKQADQLADRIINARIFEDSNGKMNISLLDTQGEILIVSQFTLLADMNQGRRPSFKLAAPPAKAEELYDYFISVVKKILKPQTGKFGAMMDVELINDGPVTFIFQNV